LAELFAALGLKADSTAIEAGERFATAHPLVQPGAGERYREAIETAFGPESEE